MRQTSFQKLTIQTVQTVAVGSTTGNLQGTNGGMRDVFVSLLTRDLKTVWTRQWPDAQDSAGINVAFDQANCSNIYVVSESKSPSTVSVRKLTNDVDNWTVVLPIADATAGGISVTRDFVYVAASNANASVCQLNKMSGNVNWCTTVAARASVGTGSIAVDFGGDVYVSGTALASLDNALIGAKDAFVARVSGDGTVQWARVYGGRGDDSGNAVAVDQDALYLVGNTFSLTINSVRKSGLLRDFFAMRLERCTGNVAWTRIWGGDGTDTIKDVAAAKGKIWLHGTSDLPGPPAVRGQCGKWGCTACGSYSQCPDLYRNNLIWYNRLPRGGLDWFTQEVWDAAGNNPRATWASIWGSARNGFNDSPAGSIRVDPITVNLTLSGSMTGYYNEMEAKRNYGGIDTVVIRYGEYVVVPPYRFTTSLCNYKGRPPLSTTTKSSTNKTTQTTKTSSAKITATTVKTSKTTSKSTVKMSVTTSKTTSKTTNKTTSRTTSKTTAKTTKTA
jgi:hypothetical protein